ncbi:MAG: ComF family protein, partial [Actinobacteria bacterium]|nr:ComF family protein [Actinomycetota bacterium]
AYSGAGRTAITRLKFDNHRDALDTWAHLMVGAIDVMADLVTWVPTSAARRRQRGVDQAELLARSVGRSCRAPVKRTLRRTSSGDQIGRDRLARRTLRFEPIRGIERWVHGATVLVVDDVRTTGASLDAAAVALRSAGASQVYGVTIAATPSRRNRPL